MTKKKTQDIPEFTSPQEEADFWDTHSTADYEEAFTPTRVRFSKNLTQGITIRLDPESLAQVRGVAHKKGIGATTLIRMWVLERLQNQSEVRGESPSHR